MHIKTSHRDNKQPISEDTIKLKDQDGNVLIFDPAGYSKAEMVEGVGLSYPIFRVNDQSVMVFEGKTPSDPLVYVCDCPSYGKFISEKEAGSGDACEHITIIQGLAEQLMRQIFSRVVTKSNYRSEVSAMFTVAREFELFRKIGGKIRRDYLNDTHREGQGERVKARHSE